MSKQVIVISTVLMLAVVGIFSFSFSILAVYGQSATTEENSAVNSTGIPQVKLIYNNQNYDMSPFVFVNNGQLNKIQFPQDEDANTMVKMQQGDVVNFQFSKEPMKVDAFVIDYEAQPAELYAMKKIGLNTFELKGPEGLQNLEVQVLYPDGQYASYTIVIYILPSHQSTQSAKTYGSIIDNNIFSQTKDQQSTGISRLTKLDVMGVTASTQNKDNAPGNVLDNNLGTMWSTKGIDVMPFVREQAKNDVTPVNKNPWIQLDLGKQRMVWDVGIAFDNVDNRIDSFAIQVSTDGVHFKDVGTAQSTPIGSPGLLYNFPDLPTSARFVRITNLGSMNTGSPSIAELIALGKTYTLSQ